ncbi:MAG: hypothetical protein HY290_14515 [Planctomycetia bacterium]|nr:hypothetical protein [Planctomycetia bacterium]
MSRFQFLVALACVALSACSRSAPVSQTRSTDDKGTSTAGQDSSTGGGSGDYVVAAPIQHGNLTIFPVLSKTPRTEDRFMTLEEGLKAKTVEIVEMGAHGAAGRAAQVAAQTAESRPESDKVGEGDEAADDDVEIAALLVAGNDVNRLSVINRGDKPLYLMPGEIIVGGSQDRTIGEETVIAATGEPVAIDVYCVEHGRWGGRDIAAYGSILGGLDDDRDDDESEAAAANRGKFVAKAGTLSKSSSLAVQAAEGQGKVWEEVATANSASGAKWASGAFTANYVDPDVVKKLRPYIDALTRPVSDHEQVVGIVVAINGKIETVDVFESTPLFRKLWPQLLKSFALDALQSEDADDEESKTIVAQTDAQEFLAKILHDQPGENRKTEGGLVVSRHETKDAISFSAGGMMGGMGGGMAAPVHAAGFAK